MDNVFMVLIMVFVVWVGSDMWEKNKKVEELKQELANYKTTNLMLQNQCH